MPSFRTKSNTQSTASKLDPEVRRKLLKQSDQFAEILDNAIRIPGTNIRIGLDSVIGFIPGIGDAAGLGLSLLVVGQAWRAGIPKPVLAKMLGNVALDGVLGLVPIVGDLFDVVFRANDRNMKILREELAEPEPPPTVVPFWKRSGVVVAGVWVAILLAYWAGKGFPI